MLRFLCPPPHTHTLWFQCLLAAPLLLHPQENVTLPLSPSSPSCSRVLACWSVGDGWSLRLHSRFKANYRSCWGRPAWARVIDGPLGWLLHLPGPYWRQQNGESLRGRRYLLLRPIQLSPISAGVAAIHLSWVIINSPPPISPHPSLYSLFW